MYIHQHSVLNICRQKSMLKSDLPKHLDSSRKLSISIRDQFLFLKMKLCLYPPSKDLSKDLKILLKTGHHIYTSWSKSSAKVLRSFTFVPDLGIIINATSPFILKRDLRILVLKLIAIYKIYLIYFYRQVTMVLYRASAHIPPSYDTYGV